jgi:hypothetical protein
MASFLGVSLSETTNNYSFHIGPVYATLSAHLIFLDLTLILLMWRIWWALNNASKWQMGFNSAFKGLITPPVFGAAQNLLISFSHSFIAACSFLPPWYKYPPQLPVLTQHSLYYSNKSPTRYKNFPVYFPDVYLQLSIFRAGPTTNTARLSPRYEGKTKLPLQSLSSWWWAGKRPKHVELYINVRIINWKIVASGWWFIWIVRWCTDLQTLNFNSLYSSRMVREKDSRKQTVISWMLQSL